VTALVAQPSAKVFRPGGRRLRCSGHHSRGSTKTSCARTRENMSVLVEPDAQWLAGALEHAGKYKRPPCVVERTNKDLAKRTLPEYLTGKHDSSSNVLKLAKTAKVPTRLRFVSPPRKHLNVGVNNKC